ncbi:unnamed protein product [Spirodela intermedia]|uniref:Uncharacterized protein n=1 Tax=Spirodela intermedia TaxID=51605 RepID=A0A7I8J6I5_SPIIN|nr:unnamed protein product [Spirodela intermedia]CAA6665052.1 unnamed protein product [Spirodela intermedia]
MNNLAAVVLGALLAAAALSATLPLRVHGVRRHGNGVEGVGRRRRRRRQALRPGGDCFSVPDVTAWGGVMWPGHEYFQWGAIDAFSGRARCLAAPPWWYCEFVQVTATGPRLPCHQRTFKVQQWLSLDEPPHKLSAVRDECGSGGGGGNDTSKGLQ